MFFPSGTVAIVKKYLIFFFFQNKKETAFRLSLFLFESNETKNLTL